MCFYEKNRLHFAGAEYTYLKKIIVNFLTPGENDRIKILQQQKSPKKLTLAKLLTSN